MTFNNPLLTLSDIQIDLYPTFYFLVFQPTSCVYMCLYVIHVDLIEPFCRSQLKKEQTACWFELCVLVWFWDDFYHKC